MIVCPNCNHQNPDGAVQCEACYTPLPASMACPNCGASVQSDASFCGQCGFNLKVTAPVPSVVEPPAATIASSPPQIPDLVPPDPLLVPESFVPEPVPEPSATNSPAIAVPPEPTPDVSATSQEEAVLVAPVASAEASIGNQVQQGQTQLQQQNARLLHVQTNASIELPQTLSVIHMGKPNDRIPPDVDLSGFPNSEIVSRIHADIRLEGDAYYIEDVGSSNGTYINNLPLTVGNRHRLRPGDRISLGKGDKVTFLFQLS